GRPEQADIVGRAVLACAGLVADAPVLRQARPQSRIPGLVTEEPGRELPPRRRGEDVPENERAKVPEHRRRTRRVARIPGQRLIQIRLDAVEAGRLIAQRASEGRQAGGGPPARMGPPPGGGFWGGGALSHDPRLPPPPP